ncbi:MAG TPA: TonB-dependent siderophore receptor, partial [Vicinamibacteria bacterium]|nr:TonB-dependent siderophore receptor [Vicinamibacteria bacterium]
MRSSLLAFAVAALAVLPAPLRAADPAPEPAADPTGVAGVVVDVTGAILVGADVALQAGEGPGLTTRSDTSGRFQFANAPRGPLVLTIQATGFSQETVSLDRPRGGVRVVLQPEGLYEEVTVRAPRPNVLRTSTATRTDSLLRDVPQSVSVVTRDQVAEQSMQNMSDLVRYVPGVGMAQGEGNRDTPIFRGNSSTSDFFVDGIRDDAQYFRDLYNVDRVEALKGPNAMIFGRGGVGGVLNRVVRQANWAPTREIGVQGGSWTNRRVTGDFDHPLNDRVAARVTGVYENSESYRNDVGLERYGVNPTVAFAIGPDTTLRAGYEYFHDDRTADRGISSFAGRPVETDPGTFFGNPDDSFSRISVNTASAEVEHRFEGHTTLRSRARFADYDKFYQNVFPGAVNAAGTTVSISGYNNGSQRQNLFVQNDLVLSRKTGSVGHTLLAGFELGRQVTDNLRNTAYFTTLGPNVTTVQVPLSDPRTSLPATYRPGASDADNHSVAHVAAFYLQDQVALSPRWQAILGLRYDRFTVDFHNNRTSADLDSQDNLVSPRVGLVYKPLEPVSVYGSYSLSYLPRAGEQLSSLSATNQALDPERFRSYEVGAKWDVGARLSVTGAAYRLDRENVAVPDPNNPAVSVLVDAQRTKGLELGVSGSFTAGWTVLGGYAYQDGEITRSVSATAQAGARLAQLPEHTFSLWNRYD